MKNNSITWLMVVCGVHCLSLDASGKWRTLSCSPKEKARKEEEARCAVERVKEEAVLQSAKNIANNAALEAQKASDKTLIEIKKAVSDAIADAHKTSEAVLVKVKKEASDASAQAKKAIADAQKVSEEAIVKAKKEASDVAAEAKKAVAQAQEATRLATLEIEKVSEKKSSEAKDLVAQESQDEKQKVTQEVQEILPQEKVEIAKSSGQKLEQKKDEGIILPLEVSDKK